MTPVPASIAERAKRNAEAARERNLELASDGGRDRRRLTTRLKGLYETTLYFESESTITAPGALLASFDIDKRTGEVVVNLQMRWLYEQSTYLPSVACRLCDPAVQAAVLTKQTKLPGARLNHAARLGHRKRDFR